MLVGGTLRVWCLVLVLALLSLCGCLGCLFLRFVFYCSAGFELVWLVLFALLLW